MKIYVIVCPLPSTVRIQMYIRQPINISRSTADVDNLCMHVKSLQLLLTLCDPMDHSQAPLSIGLSRQEYWSGLLCPPPGDLLNFFIFPALADGISVCVCVCVCVCVYF